MLYICIVYISADYQRLIESIVQDGKLYSSFQHQSVFKVCIYWI